MKVWKIGENIPTCTFKNDGLLCGDMIFENKFKKILCPAFNVVRRLCSYDYKVLF